MESLALLGYRMNPYNHQAIENTLDLRLVDLFVKQNPTNDWISLNDTARWVYQCNDVRPHHLRYVNLKMMRIVGQLYTREQHDSFLESGYVEVNGEREFAFRLKPDVKTCVYSCEVASGVAE